MICRLLLLIAVAIPAAAQPMSIDAVNSAITVHAYKSGLFSFAGHDHTISAPIASGTLDQNAGSIEFTVAVKEMQVLDPDESLKNRTEIRQTMLGAQLLDFAKFPTIAFRSTSIRPVGSAGYDVRGNLTLHGVTRPISLTVSKKGTEYTGSTKLKQTDYGMTPVSVAGGTIKVKDEVTVEFKVAAK